MITKRANGQTNMLVFFYVIVLILAMVGTYFWQQQRVNDLTQQKKTLEQQLATKETQTPTPKATTSSFEYKSSKNIQILVYTPTANSMVTSPIIIFGQVPGNWSFEAQFPIKLEDQNGKVIGQTTANLQGDWMTDKLTPFTAKIDASLPSGQKGTLVLQKDNPSGLAKNDDSLKISVNF